MKDKYANFNPLSLELQAAGWVFLLYIVIGPILGMTLYAFTRLYP